MRKSDCACCRSHQECPTSENGTAFEHPQPVTLQAEVEIRDFHSGGWILTGLDNVAKDPLNVFLHLAILAVKPQLLRAFCLTIAM